MFRGAQTAEERAASHAEEQRITEATLRAREVNATLVLLTLYRLVCACCTRKHRKSCDQLQCCTFHLLGIKDAMPSHPAMPELVSLCKDPLIQSHTDITDMYQLCRLRMPGMRRRQSSCAWPGQKSRLQARSPCAWILRS